jgi:hypothetical protein
MQTYELIFMKKGVLCTVLFLHRGQNLIPPSLNPRIFFEHFMPPHPLPLLSWEKGKGERKFKIFLVKILF